MTAISFSSSNTQQTSSRPQTQTGSLLPVLRHNRRTRISSVLSKQVLSSLSFDAASDEPTVCGESRFFGAAPGESGNNANESCSGTPRCREGMKRSLYVTPLDFGCLESLFSLYGESGVGEVKTGGGAEEEAPALRRPSGSRPELMPAAGGARKFAAARPAAGGGAARPTLQRSST